MKKIFLIGLALLFVGCSQVSNEKFSLPEGVSMQEFLEKTVLEIKSTKEFPWKISENHSLTDMTTEPGILQYHFSVILVDPETPDYTKDSAISASCEDFFLRFYLEQEITIEYIYVADNPEQSFLVSVTEADCLK